MASPSIARAEAAAGRPPSIALSGWCRIVTRSIGMIIVLVPCVLAHGIWRFLRQSSPWPRLFLRSGARIAGARVKLIGTPVRRNVVYVSNHINWIDILAIAGRTGSAFVAKAEIKTAPVVGWLADLNHTVYVAREDRSGVAEQINRLREALPIPGRLPFFRKGRPMTDSRCCPSNHRCSRYWSPHPKASLFSR